MLANDGWVLIRRLKGLSLSSLKVIAVFKRRMKYTLYVSTVKRRNYLWKSLTFKKLMNICQKVQCIKTAVKWKEGRTKVIYNGYTFVLLLYEIYQNALRHTYKYFDKETYVWNHPLSAIERYRSELVAGYYVDTHTHTRITLFIMLNILILCFYDRISPAAQRIK